MFQGASPISLDAKARLAVPTRYREAIQAQGQGKVVVTAHPHRCLLLYPAPAWEPIALKIMSQPGMMNPQVALYQELLVGHADELEMDSAGRILLSPTLREWSGIERDVMMFGQGTHFKLWNPATWNEQYARVSQQTSGSLPPGMDTLTL